MIIVLRPSTKQNDVELLSREIVSKYDVRINPIVGTETTVLGLVGETQSVDIHKLRSMDIVEKVIRVQEPYKKANRAFHPQDTIVEVQNRKIGEGNFSVMAGPCSVESEEQLTGIAKAVQASGAAFLRGGAFKPRTSPYAFQGLGPAGLELLIKAKKETGLPIVTEVMDLSQLSAFDDVDIIQVGARNMQNFTLLKELGRLRKPILLKRGISATMRELLMAAEYIMAGGNEQIILCERGIRTFETATRNTLDISAIPVLKRQTHLPIIVDPSHAAGLSWAVEALSKAALAVGADGLMVEVHNDPQKALCDGDQALTPEAFDHMMSELKRYAKLENKNI